MWGTVQISSLLYSKTRPGPTEKSGAHGGGPRDGREEALPRSPAGSKPGCPVGTEPPQPYSAIPDSFALLIFAPRAECLTGRCQRDAGDEHVGNGLGMGADVARVRMRRRAE